MGCSFLWLLTFEQAKESNSLVARERPLKIRRYTFQLLSLLNDDITIKEFFQLSTAEYVAKANKEKGCI
jgi:hypothetical protein